MSNATVFISYSKHDVALKDKVVKHLGVSQQFTLWDDSRIDAGEDWLQAILAAIEAGQIVILLVSVNSLTTEFILREEVPRMLAKRAAGAWFYPIIVGDCDWQGVAWLQNLNVRPVKGRVLGEDDTGKITPHQIDKDLAAIAKEIRQSVENRHHQIDIGETSVSSNDELQESAENGQHQINREDRLSSPHLIENTTQRQRQEMITHLNWRRITIIVSCVLLAALLGRRLWLYFHTNLSTPQQQFSIPQLEILQYSLESDGSRQTNRFRFRFRSNFPGYLYVIGQNVVRKNKSEKWIYLSNKPDKVLQLESNKLEATADFLFPRGEGLTATPSMPEPYTLIWSTGPLRDSDCSCFSALEMTALTPQNIEELEKLRKKSAQRTPTVKTEGGITIITAPNSPDIPVFIDINCYWPRSDKAQ